MSDSLEYLLGSKIKSRLVKTLILNPKLELSAAELAERIKSPARSVSNEIKKMNILGLVKCRNKNRKKYYQLDKNFIFYPELKNIVAKCNVTPESRLLNGIKSSGKVSYALLTGVFTENKKAAADLIVVGEELQRSKLRKVIAEIEAELGREIRYSVMSGQEYLYRLEMFDKFIIDINKGSHIILVDKLKKKPSGFRLNS